MGGILAGTIGGVLYWRRVVARNTIVGEEERVDRVLATIRVSQPAFRAILERRTGSRGRYGSLAELVREGLAEQGIADGQVGNYRLYCTQHERPDWWVVVAVPGNSEARWYVTGSSVPTIYYRIFSEGEVGDPNLVLSDIIDGVTSGRIEASGWLPSR